ncbi:MAG: hypothetical protein MI806_11725 [Minwuiales bacterium]|nr:hypothetical protein [Minwuiales bacterium]
MQEAASSNSTSKHDRKAPTRTRLGGLAAALAIAATVTAANASQPSPAEAAQAAEPDGQSAKNPVSASINAVTHEIALPPELEWPNGIAFDGRNRLLVGAITEPAILRFENGAWTITEIAAPGVFSVTSLTYDSERDLVWGTSPAFLEEDSDRRHGLYALNSESLEMARFLRLPDDGFANDTEIAADGSLLVTDSVNGRVLAYDWARDEFDMLIEDERLRPLERVGAAGITADADGRVYIANFETGRLFVLMDGVLRRIELPRRLENPDGLAFTGNGALLAVEGAVQSGDGRLIRVPDPAEPGLRRLEILLDRLESPVNLTVDASEAIYVTESRIRRRIGPTPTQADPAGFRVVVFGQSS